MTDASLQAPLPKCLNNWGFLYRPRAAVFGVPGPIEVKPKGKGVSYGVTLPIMPQIQPYRQCQRRSPLIGHVIVGTRSYRQRPI